MMLWFGSITAAMTGKLPTAGHSCTDAATNRPEGIRQRRRIGTRTRQAGKFALQATRTRAEGAAA